MKIGESTHGEIDAFISPVADTIRSTIDKVEYEVPTMLNYTAVRTHFQENRPEVWEETLLMAPRKIFTGVKVLHEEAAGLYDERSSAQ